MLSAGAQAASAGERGNGWAILASAGEWTLRSENSLLSVAISCPRAGAGSTFHGAVPVAARDGQTPTALRLITNGRPVERLALDPSGVWQAPNARMLVRILAYAKGQTLDDAMIAEPSGSAIVENGSDSLETIGYFDGLCSGRIAFTRPRP